MSDQARRKYISSVGVVSQQFLCDSSEDRSEVFVADVWGQIVARRGVIFVLWFGFVEQDLFADFMRLQRLLSSVSPAKIIQL